MSKSLRKRKNHWTNKVHESVLGRSGEGALGLELKGGAENGQFPVIGAGRAAGPNGKLSPDELLLEVNDTPVAGLTTRDVHAVVKHSKEPVRLKCVKQGERKRQKATFFRQLLRLILLRFSGLFQADSLLFCGQTFPAKPNFCLLSCRLLPRLRNFGAVLRVSGVFGAVWVVWGGGGGPVAMCSIEGVCSGWLGVKSLSCISPFPLFIHFLSLK